LLRSSTDLFLFLYDTLLFHFSLYWRVNLVIESVYFSKRWQHF